MNVVRARAFAEVDKYLEKFDPKKFDDNAKALQEIEIYIAQHFSVPWAADNLSVQNQGIDRRYRKMFNQFVSVIGCYDDLYKYYAAAIKRKPRRAPSPTPRIAEYSLLDGNSGKKTAVDGGGTTGRYPPKSPFRSHFPGISRWEIGIKSKSSPGFS